MPSTPATAGVYSPSHAINARHRGRLFSTHAINARHRGRLFSSHAINARHRGRLFPLAKSITSAVGRCLFPLAIYGEGVPDRPGVRSKTQTKPPQKPKKPATRAGFDD